MRVRATDGATDEEILAFVEVRADRASDVKAFRELDRRAGIDAGALDPNALAVVRMARITFEAAKAIASGFISNAFGYAPEIVVVRPREDGSDTLTVNGRLTLR